MTVHRVGETAENQRKTREKSKVAENQVFWLDFCAKKKNCAYPLSLHVIAGCWKTCQESQAAFGTTFRATGHYLKNPKRMEEFSELVSDLKRSNQLIFNFLHKKEATQKALI